MYEVYLITNLVNGRQYVGITCRGYQLRFKEHIADALSGSSTTILHNAIRKYGPENFKLELLAKDVPAESANIAEMQFIQQYGTFYTSGGYNMTEGGGGMVGYHHTSETKAILHDKFFRRPVTDEYREHMRQKMLNREYKQEWKDALSIARLGRFTKDENPFYGKHHTNDAKQQISNANTKHHVIQLSIETNEEIQEFFNAQVAGEWVVSQGITSAKPSTCAVRIMEVCKSTNVQCSAYGYRWRYREKSID